MIAFNLRHTISLVCFALPTSFSLDLFVNNIVFMSSSGEIKNTTIQIQLWSKILKKMHYFATVSHNNYYGNNQWTLKTKRFKGSKSTKRTTTHMCLLRLNCILVNRGEWLRNPANIKEVNKDYKIYVGMSTTVHNYITKTFLLVSSSVSSNQLLCFVFGQGQKREQNTSNKELWWVS